MYDYNDLAMVNAYMKSTPVKGKPYVEVNERIKAFRKLCPHGAIITEMLSNEGGVCVFKASIYDEEKNLIGTGTAYEKEGSTNINKTSYIENCETSAVGRALGMCGFGIDTSIASAEEVINAINNQEMQGAVPYTPKKSPRQMLMARLKELGIDATEYAAQHNLDKQTPDDVFTDLLKDLQ